MSVDTSLCWCGKPENRTVLQCSHCNLWVHYLCTGICLRDLDSVIHDTPGLYLCRNCCDLPNAKKISAQLLKANKANQIFAFSHDMYAVMNLPGPMLMSLSNSSSLATTVTSIKDSLHDIAEKQNSLPEVSAKVDLLCNRPLVSTTARSSYAIASRGHTTSSSNFRQSAQALFAPFSVPAAPQRHVTPENSLIIEKTADPKKFAPSLTLKKELTRLDPSLAAIISATKVINSGKILIEALDSEKCDAVLKILEPHLINIFGPDSKIRKMDSLAAKGKDFAVIRGLPLDYGIEELKAEIITEYPSLTGIISLVKPNSTPRSQSIRVALNNLNELTRLKQHGVHIGYCLFRAEEWIQSPLRCFKCQRFNHVASTCLSQSRCVNCGENHPPIADATCKKPPKCANCSGNHRSNFNGCKNLRDSIRGRQMNINNGYN